MLITKADANKLTKESLKRQEAEELDRAAETIEKINILITEAIEKGEYHIFYNTLGCSPLVIQKLKEAGYDISNSREHGVAQVVGESIKISWN